MVNTVLDAVAPSHAREHLRAQLSSDLTGAMGAFLDDQTTTVLQATLAGDVVTCANSVSFDTSSTAQVVLTKLRPGPLRPSDIPHAVSVSSMAHSPVSALYHQLRQVYGPLLGNDARGDGAAPVDAKLRGLVAELEAGLGNVLRLTGGVGDLARVDPADSPSGGHRVAPRRVHAVERGGVRQGRQRAHPTGRERGVPRVRTRQGTVRAP